jgi:hypothetical protein
MHYYKIVDFDSVDYIRHAYKIQYIWWTALAGTYLGCVFQSEDEIHDVAVEEIAPETSPQFNNAKFSDAVCITIRGDEKKVMGELPMAIEKMNEELSHTEGVEANKKLLATWIPILIKGMGKVLAATQ